MTAAHEQGVLFDACQFAPKPVRQDPPAYRPGRAWALQEHACRLAEFRRHQHACAQCMNAADAADAKGTKAHEQLCTEGYLIFYRFAVVNARPLCGYYPDHDRTAAARARPPTKPQEKS